VLGVDSKRIHLLLECCIYLFEKMAFFKNPKIMMELFQTIGLIDEMVSIILKFLD
jgi:hypothetical protein